MRRTFLIIDVASLAYRAYYSLGPDLEHDGKPTGVIFGVLAEMKRLEEQFNTNHFAFAFDSKTNLRKIRFKWYKAKRNEDEERAGIAKIVHAQVNRLHSEILPALGYSNLFDQEGYEGDDIVASMVWHLMKGIDAVVISSDHDLFQILRQENTILWRPQSRELMTEKIFREKFYDLPPRKWAKIQAIAGCVSDNIVGLEGVGYITAAKYISGQLSRRHKCFPLISDFVAHDPQYKDNLIAAKMPYLNCFDFHPVPDPPPDVRAWDSVCESLGIQSLAGPSGARVGLKRENVLRR